MSVSGQRSVASCRGGPGAPCRASTGALGGAGGDLPRRTGTGCSASYGTDRSWDVPRHPSALRSLPSAVYTLPKLYSKNYYCVGCAVHSRIVRVRNKVARRNRDPPVRFRRTDAAKKTA
jgi:hypothetical protein